MQVSEVLRVKGNALFTVGPDTPLSECVATMAEHDIGSLVVMDRGKLAGMFTFREVLKALAGRRPRAVGSAVSLDSIRVRELMNPSPCVAGPSMELNELRRTMLDNRQRYLPVLDGDTLLGVVSFHDVAKAVLEEQGFENRMLKAYIRDWPAEG